MANQYEIFVNGQNFTQWETVSWTRSLDNPIGDYTFSSPNTFPAGYPIKAGAYVQIIANGFSRVAGFVDNVNGKGGASGHTVTVAGRDSVQDLLDSSVPDSAKSLSGNQTMQTMCQAVIGSLGLSIPVIDDSGGIAPFSATDITVASTGQRCLDYLISFARKRQVYLVTDGAGGLVIFRPGTNMSSTPILHKTNNRSNNVLSYDININHANRFNHYRTSSQDNFGSDANADYKGDGASRKGDLFDPEIRATRYLEVQGEETMSDGESGERANEIANVRRAESLEYSCTIPGAFQNNGQPWDYGLLVQVQDDYAGVNGVLLTRSVSTSVNLSGGTVTTLTFADPAAYSVKGALTQVDLRRASMGTNLSEQTGQPAPQFERGV